jgi:tRNA (guanine-N7-)-methyltransferase
MVIQENPAFTIHPANGDDARNRPDDWPGTRYEAKAVAAGRQPWYFIVRRRDRLLD